MGHVYAWSEPELKTWISDKIGIATPGAIQLSADITSADRIEDALIALQTWPVVVKATFLEPVHKSDIGGVVTGLSTKEAVISAVASVSRAGSAARPDSFTGVLIEPQVAQGPELIVGVRRDPSFGGVVMVGLGGTMTEAHAEVVFGFHPMTLDGSRALLSRLPGIDVLERRFGHAVEQLTDALNELGRAGGALDLLPADVGALEINPLILTPSGAVAVDVRVEPLAPVPSLRALPHKRPLEFAADLSRALQPTTIAVVGASRSGGSLGNFYLSIIRQYGFAGRLFAVHGKADLIDDVPAYPTLGDIPDHVDYAVIAVPADEVPPTLLAASGNVSYAHIITSGFGELGPKGAQLEEQVLDAAGLNRMRVLGPNCLGIYDTRGRITFLPDPPEAVGDIAIVSQSGGLSGDIMRELAGRGLSMGTVASIGNSVDVDAADFVNHFLHDPDTSVIGLYLEGSDFVERLKRCLYQRTTEARKPIVVLRGGRTESGAAAAASHTGALATDYRLWEAIAAEHGICLVRSVEEFVGTLGYLSRHAERVLATSSHDAGVVVVGPGGGASVLVTDALVETGLGLARLPDQTVANLEAMNLGPGAAYFNPIDLPLWALVKTVDNRDSVSSVLERIAEGQEVGDVLVHLNLPNFFLASVEDGPARCIDIIESLGRVQSEHRMRISLVVRGSTYSAETLRLRTAALETGAESRVPVYDRIEDAVAAIAASRRCTSTSSVSSPTSGGE